MRKGAGAQPSSANSNRDRHPSRPMLSSGPRHLYHPPGTHFLLISPPPVPHPQAQTRHWWPHGLPCQLSRRQPEGPSLTDRTSMPTSGPAWPGQEQDDLPRGVAVRACRRQVTWVPPDPAQAPQAWGKRIRPALLVSNNVSL